MRGQVFWFILLASSLVSACAPESDAPPFIDKKKHLAIQQLQAVWNYGANPPPDQLERRPTVRAPSISREEVPDSSWRCVKGDLDWHALVYPLFAQKPKNLAKLSFQRELVRRGGKDDPLAACAASNVVIELRDTTDDPSYPGKVICKLSPDEAPEGSVQWFLLAIIEEAIRDDNVHVMKWINTYHWLSRRFRPNTAILQYAHERGTMVGDAKMRQLLAGSDRSKRMPADQLAIVREAARRGDFDAVRDLPLIPGKDQCGERLMPGSITAEDWPNK